jgi:hypothetical protein
LQCLYHFLKVLAKSATERVHTAPTHSFLRISWASSLFALENREMSVGSKSGEYGGAGAG